MKTNQIGKLTTLCGKMGAGKSTKAAQLAKEENAVLLSEDAWLSSHFPNEIQSFDDYIERSKRIRPFVKSVVQSILSAGSDVVMDFPANTASQRLWFKNVAAEISAPLEIIFLNTKEELCLIRIMQRRKDLPERIHFDTEENFRKVTAFFEAPGKEEGIRIYRIDTFA